MRDGEKSVHHKTSTSRVQRRLEPSRGLRSFCGERRRQTSVNSCRLGYQVRGRAELLLSPPTMSLLLQLSVIAVSLATSVVASPLSTDPLFAPSRGSPFGLAPLVAPEHAINNSYIVMFRDDVSPQLRDNHLNFLLSVNQADPLVGDESGLTHVYDGPVKGYAGRFTEGVVDQIRAMPEVDFVERDQIVRTQNITTQRDATWVSPSQLVGIRSRTNKILRDWPVSAIGRL